MAGMSVSTGLISGIDYSTMIDQLMQVEANPQTLLKKQLSSVKADAAAYRAVNTRFDALRTAAAALTDASAWSAVKATTSNTTVTATASGTATAGSFTFTVDTLAATHSVFSGAQPSATTALDPAAATTITITDSDGDRAATTITLAAGKTLADAADAINASSTAGVNAVVVNTGSGYRLQLTSKTSGLDGAFNVTGDLAVTKLTDGVDAKITIGGTNGYAVTSPSNTFTDVLKGTTFTVSEKGATATVSVASDPGSVATKVKNLVDAANSLLDSVSSYTDADSDAAILKGDSTLRGLSNQILEVVSRGFGGTVPSTFGGTSASTVGIQLTKDGKFTFDSAAFTAKLSSDPATVKDLFTKKNIVSAGVDGISGNADDVTSPVGFAAKLEALAKGASDTTTGSLVLIAKSEDSLAKDLQARIDDWDTRLALRKDSLTRQFTAMETALGTLQNQSSWLSSQIAGLPSWSSSK